jgi:hypothetical protein
MPPSTAALMLSLSNAMISLLPSVPGGMPAAVIAVLMVWMPAPFDGTGPSQGGRDGIFELEENNVDCNRGSIHIVLTPFLWNQPSDWYGNQTCCNMQAGQYLLLFQAGKRVTMDAAPPPAEYWGLLLLSHQAKGNAVLRSSQQLCLPLYLLTMGGGRAIQWHSKPYQQRCAPPFRCGWEQVGRRLHPLWIQCCCLAIQRFCFCHQCLEIYRRL